MYSVNWSSDAPLSLGLIIVAAVVFMAVFAPLISP